MRITLSLTFVALSLTFSNTPHTGCNDAAPEVVEALAAEQGYAPHMVKSCGDIMALGGCSTLKTNGYSEICCASCASAGGPMKSTYSLPEDGKAHG